MPSYERGTYEPADDVRVFDGAEDEEDEEGSRLPLLIVMALLVLAAFGGVVWLAYERGVASGRTEPRILTAEQGPVKVAPAASSEGETPYKGLKIYEQPAPNDEEAGAEPADTSAAPAATKPTTPAAAPTSMTANAMTPTQKPVVVAKPVKPVQTASSAPSPMTAAKPVASPVAKPTPPIDVPVATARPTMTAVSAGPSEAAAKPAVPASTDTPKPAASGAYVLQIGAYKSQGEADTSWRAFQAKHGALLSGFSSDVKQVDLGDKGTWYRLRIGSFPDKDSASALCEKLKADGGNCFLAK